LIPVNEQLSKILQQFSEFTIAAWFKSLAADVTVSGTLLTLALSSSSSSLSAAAAAASNSSSSASDDSGTRRTVYSLGFAQRHNDTTAISFALQVNGVFVMLKK